MEKDWKILTSLQEKKGTKGVHASVLTRQSEEPSFSPKCDNNQCIKILKDLFQTMKCIILDMFLISKFGKLVLFSHDTYQKESG